MARCTSWDKAFFQTGPTTVLVTHHSTGDCVPIEWVILGDIVNGLVFIQSLGCVHPSDLKPRNGRISPTTLMSKW